MEPQKRIISEPVSLIRRAAFEAMKGRMGLLVLSAALYTLCLGLPAIIVEQISGFWDVFVRANDEFAALIDTNGSFSYAEVNDWAQAYADKLSLSPAVYVLFLLLPGPLSLGLSSIWLRVLRGKEAYASMVFSGFDNFPRALLVHFMRGILIFLWSILLLIPGIIAHYRYSLVFFLLADNPKMNPIEALSLSRYYMRYNKGARFLLDLSFIGWFALSLLTLILLNNIITITALSAGGEAPFFASLLVSAVLSALVYAPVRAYNGLAAAEFYHRVICKDPRTALGNAD